MNDSPETIAAATVAFDASIPELRILRAEVKDARRTLRYLQEAEKPAPCYHQFKRLDVSEDELDSIEQDIEAQATVVTRPALLLHMFGHAADHASDMVMHGEGSRYYPLGGFAETLVIASDAIARLADMAGENVDRDPVTVNLSEPAARRVRDYMVESRSDVEQLYLNHADEIDRLLETMPTLSPVEITTESDLIAATCSGVLEMISDDLRGGRGGVIFYERLAVLAELGHIVDSIWPEDDAAEAAVA